MKPKPEQKTKVDYKKLKELLLQKRDIFKQTDLVDEFNKFYGSSRNKDNDKDGEKKITEGRLRKAILYSCGEIYKSSDGSYTVGHVPNYNGVNGTAVVSLRKLQRDVDAFPNPFIYRINKKMLMLEVKPKYADKAKYLLNKAFTKRYIYDIFLQGNQLIIFLLSESEREACNNSNGNEARRTNKFNQIELGDKNFNNPLLEDVNASQELSCKQIIEMLKMIVKTRELLKEKRS